MASITCHLTFRKCAPALQGSGNLPDAEIINSWRKTEMKNLKIKSMKKIMTVALLTGILFTANATLHKKVTANPDDATCNFTITYPCPGNTQTRGCFATYDDAAAYLAQHPAMNCRNYQN
jgi:hypothetical protein